MELRRRENMQIIKEREEREAFEKVQENKQKHLEHPFYKRVKNVVDEIEVEQILKGSEKYPEPFNPASWTGKELAWHALQELRDGQVYVVGLLDHIERQEQMTKDNFEVHKALTEKYKRLEKEFEQERNIVINLENKTDKLGTYLIENYPSEKLIGFAVDIAIDKLKRAKEHETEYDQLVDKYEQLEKEYDGLMNDYAKEGEELEKHKTTLLKSVLAFGEVIAKKDREIERLKTENEAIRNMLDEQP